MYVESQAMPCDMLSVMWTDYDPSICKTLISSKSHRMEI